MGTPLNKFVERCHTGCQVDKKRSKDVNPGLSLQKGLNTCLDMQHRFDVLARHHPSVRMQRHLASLSERELHSPPIVLSWHRNPTIVLLIII
eukprot:scaffold7838_cov140-Skeletonema_marinoi.AAC.15